MRIAYEARVNVALARLLRGVGFDAAPERIGEGGRRVDVLLLRRGLRIALEGSYDPRDAEEDARRRLEEQLCDMAVAVWYDSRSLPQDLPEEELGEALGRSTLRVRIFAPGKDVSAADVTGTVLDYLRREDARRLPPEPLTAGWLGVDVPLLARCIDLAIQYLVPESAVREAEARIRRFVDGFARALGNLDAKLRVCEELYNIFYRLYGLSVGDPKSIRDLVYGKAALALLLSAVFYESVRAHHGLESLKARAAGGSYYRALVEAFDDILEVDYEPIFEVAREIVHSLPTGIEPRLEELVDLAVDIASNRVLLRRDFAGRIYHTIVGDWAVRKGFATYFTSVPAAHTLARLALVTPNPSWPRFCSLNSFRVADLACGSGTLLSASYDALLYLYSRDRVEAGLGVDLEEFHRVVLERVIWGLDALRFATHIAATTLALHNPEVTLKSMNLYTVPLGLDPKGTAFLGSLDVARGALVSYLERYERVSATSEERTTLALPNADLVIMNPPFTRATGRGERGGGSLFGFIVDEGVRERLLREYVRFREYVRSELVKIAKNGGHLERYRGELGEGSLRTLEDVGQAGEGLLFLYVAGRKTAAGGRIAFVLPRNLLSGVSWFLARSYLVSEFHPEYVVVSYDADGGYNFSESTQLSECLIVARRVSEHSSDERTCFVLLLRKPSTALEGAWLADEVVRKCAKGGEINLVERDYGAENYVKANGAGGVVYTVPRRLLLEHLDNWGVLAAFPDPRLTRVSREILSGSLFGASVPVVRLGRIATIGVDRHQFHDAFKKVGGNPPGSYPCVYGGGEERRTRMLVSPNARIVPRSARGDELFRTFSSNLLVPDRVRLDTAHVIALYSTEPVLSNIFYAVRLRGSDDRARLKALCAWLNSTWGVLSALAYREETEGAWISLKMTHWRLLPVLDVASLPGERVEELAEAFERFKLIGLRRLPEQYSGQQRERLELDTAVLEALEPGLSEKVRLAELYRWMGEALKMWIGRGPGV